MGCWCVPVEQVGEFMKNNYLWQGIIVDSTFL